MSTPAGERPAVQRATISVEESAALLGLSRSAAYEAINNGSFPVPVLMINNHRYIPRAHLEAVLGIVDTSGTRSGEIARAARDLRDLYRAARALHAHLGIELDRLAVICGEIDDTAAPTERAAS